MDIRGMLKDAANRLISHAKKRNMKSKYAYMRILAQLEAADEPIYDVREVKGAGKKTQKFFAKYLESLLPAGAAHSDMDGCVVHENAATSGANMPAESSTCAVAAQARASRSPCSQDGALAGDDVRTEGFPGVAPSHRSGNDM